MIIVVNLYLDQIGIPFTLSVIADVGQIFATIVSILLAKYRYFSKASFDAIIM